MKQILTFSIFLLLLSSCVEPINKSFTKLPPGIWRGVLLLDNTPFIMKDGEEVGTKTDFSGELPFTFEVIYTDENNFYVDLINAEERVRVEEIIYNRDRATAKDTLTFTFPIYDTYINAIYEDDLMEGFWHVNYKNGYKIPFKAYFGKAHRFSTLRRQPKANVSGKWDVTFEIGTEYEYQAVAEFQQDKNHITGTFMTETGDYRFLEGTVQNDKIFLSTFDGAHAFLFEAKIVEENSLIGSFRSGKHYTTTWSAKRNKNASLGDAFELTTSKIDNEAFDFTFPNLEGQNISLSDDQFRDKIKLVKITGTWCPNCKDEALFLRNYLENNPSDDIEVIEIAFERYKDDTKAIEILKGYQKTMELPFTYLYGGYANKTATSEKFPQISKVLSYPTLIFVDKENKIRKIHTGFAGPATSEFEGFKTKFHNLISEMRN